MVTVQFCDLNDFGKPSNKKLGLVLGSGIELVYDTYIIQNNNLIHFWIAKVTNRFSTTWCIVSTAAMLPDVN